MPLQQMNLSSVSTFEHPNFLLFFLFLGKIPLPNIENFPTISFHIYWSETTLFDVKFSKECFLIPRSLEWHLAGLFIHPFHSKYGTHAHLQFKCKAARHRNMSQLVQWNKSTDSRKKSNLPPAVNSLLTTFLILQPQCEVSHVAPPFSPWQSTKHLIYMHHNFLKRDFL